MPAGRARRLPGGTRARSWEVELPGAPVVVVKEGDPAAIAAEAAALGRLAGTGLAPALVADADGLLVTARIAPRPVPPNGLARMRAVGRLLGRLHALERPARAAYPGWDEAAGDLGAYRRRRAGDRPMPPPPVPGAGEGFALVHGDAWSGNVVWGSRGPVLVDWDHMRAGDPAEDLAYLAAMDDLPAADVAALLDGHGGSGLAGAVEWWRPLLAGECADWYAAEGQAARAAALRAQQERLTRRR